MKPGYKQKVEEIRSLQWEVLSSQELQTLMILSAYAAREFAESLRIAIKLHPRSKKLGEMAKGELETSNLQFGGYTSTGDHADFLWHSIRTHQLEIPLQVYQAGETYLERVRALPPHVRASSIFSREIELPKIFERVLSAKDWNAKGLDSFRYYLEKHIELDSEKGGHADLVHHLKIDERVIDFYSARLELYRCIPALFRASYKQT